MTNLKKLSRQQLMTLTGGFSADNGCHCHGCAPSPNLPNGLPPIDIPADSPQQCWSKCDSYRKQCLSEDIG
ncbi:bacteriocin-like protein [Chryseobacterium sp. CCH4-E10]|uniref:bacteriocin-like protein n=1 Tax=Chryseobacterium sp. CCH4-E10 TaxID=1768758 RepID=UPI0012FB49B8|nr:hypothetical protein [Chryseobacterium sp. CCH4-E10]